MIYGENLKFAIVCNECGEVVDVARPHVIIYFEPKMYLHCRCFTESEYCRKDDIIPKIAPCHRNFRLTF